MCTEGTVQSARQRQRAPSRERRRPKALAWRGRGTGPTRISTSVKLSHRTHVRFRLSLHFPVQRERRGYRISCWLTSKDCCRIVLRDVVGADLGRGEDGGGGAPLDVERLSTVSGTIAQRSRRSFIRRFWLCSDGRAWLRSDAAVVAPKSERSFLRRVELRSEEADERGVGVKALKREKLVPEPRSLIGSSSRNTAGSPAKAAASRRYRDASPQKALRRSPVTVMRGSSCSVSRISVVGERLV